MVDGDTVDVDIDLGFYIWMKKQRIRMLDIDAPEMRGESKVAGAAATVVCLQELKATQKAFPEEAIAIPFSGKAARR